MQLPAEQVSLHSVINLASTSCVQLELMVPGFSQVKSI